MKFILLRLTCLMFIVNSFAQDNTLGTILITENAYEAYTLFTVNQKTYLLDNCGRVVKEWTSQYLPGVSVYLLPNGNLLRPGRLNDGTSNIGFGGQGGIIELFDWDGNLIWTWTDNTNQSRQHHDVYPMPNGNVLILSATVINAADAIQAGRDPNLLIDNELYNERIYEVEPVGANGGNIVWEWNAIDHVIQDFDATKNNFGVVVDNPQKIDLNFLNGFPAENNWLHINSIQYDQEFDQILISSRRFSEIWAIDYNTTTAEAAGPAGDLLYRWGNPQAYQQGTEADRKLFGQHTPYYIPSGLPNERKIMVFNNGFGRLPSYSEVLIINPPIDADGNYSYTPGTAFLPNDTDFRYPETAPTENAEFYSAIISNAQQLPNGNILVNQGREAIFFELDPANNIVWKYISPISNADGSSYPQGGSPPVNSFAFRAIKYDLDYPAFFGRTLTPGDPLETNPNLDGCLNVLSVENMNNFQLTFYPNPTRNIINISFDYPIDRIEIYSLNGSRVKGIEGRNRVDLSELTKGVYFLKIETNGQQFTKKVIKQ
jgi:hypothetical protein